MIFRYLPMALLATTMLASPGTSLAFASSEPAALEVPAREVSIRNFIYFGLDRERIHEKGFLATPAVVGAQLKYTWRELEPARGRYDLEGLLADLDFLERHGKRLFVQLQDVSFSQKIVNVPDYLREDPEFSGGVALQYEVSGDDETTAQPEGWVARRWDPLVRERFISLLDVLGQEIDGRIEGVNLPETALGFGVSGALFPRGYSDEGYVEGVKALMSAAEAAFPQSHVIQYANFMPGEWRPWTDRGYLQSIYDHAEKIGIGVGGPDLMPHRKGQQNHCLALIAERAPTTVAGLAVQWGNLEETRPATGERVSVAELYEYAREPLRLNYLLWGTQEPFYSRDVIPYLQGLEETSDP